MTKTLETYIEIANEVGEAVMREYERESDTSIIPQGLQHGTPIDKRAHNELFRRLAEQFPDAQILSEEGITELDDYSGRVIIIDPIDGTKQFYEKGPYWSINIAELIDGKPRIGVVYQPSMDAMYYGERDRGAYMQNRYTGKIIRIRVSDLCDLSEATLVTRLKPDGDIANPAPYIAQRTYQELARSSFGIVYISAGDMHNMHIYVHRPTIKKWDTCAHQVILEEAGGRMTDFLGDDLDYTQSSPRWERGFVATNGALHEKVLEIIDEYFGRVIEQIINDERFKDESKIPAGILPLIDAYAIREAAHAILGLGA